MSRVVLLALCLLLAGCHGQLIDALQERQIHSCVWWETQPFKSARGVTATGGVDITTCLAVPCHGR
jgi:hypothetical protein